MKVVILAGGKGTRLGDLTQYTPKPFLKINGKPFVLYLKEFLSKSGFNEVYLSLGYNAQNIPENILSDFSGAVTEEAPLGTGGAIRLCISKLNLQEPFLVINGDTFQPINLKRMVANYKLRSLKYGMVNLQIVNRQDRYSNVNVNDKCILEFGGDPNNASSINVNSGIYILDPSIFERIPNGFVSLEKDVFPSLATNQQLGYIRWKTPFIDIGIPQDFERAHKFILENNLDKILFLDRDGVLIKDTGYPSEFDVSNVNTTFINSLLVASEQNYRIIVVSNQAGVARGMFDESKVQELNDKISKYYLSQGVFIERFFYCPHHEDASLEEYRKKCNSRKPNTGMLQRAGRYYNIDYEKSFLIGDKITDIGAANEFGIKSWQVSSFPFCKYDITSINQLIC